MTTNGNVLFGDFFNFVFRVHEDAFGLPGFGLRIVHRHVSDDDDQVALGDFAGGGAVETDRAGVSLALDDIR